jgi:hypothetical protein
MVFPKQQVAFAALDRDFQRRKRQIQRRKSDLLRRKRPMPRGMWYLLRGTLAICLELFAGM